MQNIELENITHDIYNSVYDPHYRLSFGFIINGISIQINNPFHFGSHFNKVDNKARCQEFESRFKNPRQFLITLLDILESKHLKLIVNENLEDLDSNNYTEAVAGSKDDIIIYIDKHKLILNRKNLNTAMQKYWR